MGERRRRVKGTGTITRHSSGRVRAQVSLGTVNGRRERLTTYHDDAAAAQAWLTTTLERTRRGDRLPSRLPLGDYLAEWLRREARDVAPRTLRDYAAIADAMPAELRAVPLGRLSTAHVQAWIDGMTGSPRTIAWRRNMLRAALNDALRRELVDRNAAALARPPRQRRPRRVVVTAADCAAILDAVAGWRYEAAVAVAIGCGLRQGEILGLAWGDVRPDRLVIRQRLRRLPGEYVLVEGTKASDEAAEVPLPAFAREALLRWRRRQDEERRLAGGTDTIERAEAPVFTTARGGMVNGTVVTHGFQKLLAAARLPALRFHDLRHATADVLAGLGMPQTVARDYLRHASITTTADHYTGSGWDELSRAGDALGRAVGR